MTQVRLFLEKLGANFQIYTTDQLFDLLSTRNHPAYIKLHRALLNRERTRFFSLIFLAFMSLWLALDFLLLAHNTFLDLAGIKTAALVVLLIMVLSRPNSGGLLLSRLVLALFLAIFPLIFIVSSHQLSTDAKAQPHRLLLQFYALLPYLSVAGLGLFPLTLLESLSYAVSLGGITVASWIYLMGSSIEQLLPSLWLLSLMTGLAVVSSAMQLQDMISLISRASYDSLTGTLSQRSAIASLIRDFQNSVLHDHAFSIVLIELQGLDNSGRTYDPQTYDRIILEAADILREDLRSNDTLARWRDNVFLLILTETDCPGVKVTLDRLRKIGIGTLPDGQPITAAIGAAERGIDQISDWHGLIELADRRLQQANQLGEDRSVYCGERASTARTNLL